ncbi:MAG: DUF302 domain-containing protein [Proteobacteria bacterium]|nr:DUF302 domain-containing protein [Pseudomonadota bacterium]
MRMIRVVTVLFLFALAPSAFAQVVSHSIKASFDSAKEDLLLAIQGKGLVIDYTSHIGTMLERTGRDLGAKKKIFDKAEAYVFCSALVSRRAMEANAANIAHCPYGISLHALPGESGTVHVNYRRSLPEVDALLGAIVHDAFGVK